MDLPPTLNIVIPNGAPQPRAFHAMVFTTLPQSHLSVSSVVNLAPPTRCPVWCYHHLPIAVRPVLLSTILKPRNPFFIVWAAVREPKYRCTTRQKCPITAPLLRDTSRHTYSPTGAHNTAFLIYNIHKNSKIRFHNSPKMDSFMPRNSAGIGNLKLK